jgi:hypothetical protein
MNHRSIKVRAPSVKAPASQRQCQLALEDFFVEIPDGRDIDFRSVVLALDAVHGRTSGQVSSRGFLLTRHSMLNGRAPIEIIADPDGPERIWGLVNVVADDFS